MAGNRTAYQYIILFRKYFYHFQALHLHTVAAHTSCHAHTFKYAGSIGRVTDRTGSALTVVLTMRLLAYTVETMTFNNALETFTFCSAYNFHLVAFGEDVYGNGVTNIFVERRVAE